MHKEQLEKFLLQRSVDLHDLDVIYIIKEDDEVIGTFHVHGLSYIDH
jgi:hypothetical protein